MSKEELADPHLMPAWRYTFDNMQQLFQHFVQEYPLYTRANSSIRDSFAIILEICLGVSTGVLLGKQIHTSSNSLVLVGALYWPSIAKIKQERSNILRLFLSIPKAAMSTILSNLNSGNEVKEIEDEAFEDSQDIIIAASDYAHTSTSLLNKLSIRYHATLCKESPRKV